MSRASFVWNPFPYFISKNLLFLLSEASFIAFYNFWLSTLSSNLLEVCFFAVNYYWIFFTTGTPFLFGPMFIVMFMFFGRVDFTAFYSICFYTSGVGFDFYSLPKDFDFSADFLFFYFLALLLEEDFLTWGVEWMDELFFNYFLFSFFKTSCTCLWSLILGNFAIISLLKVTC